MDIHNMDESPTVSPYGDNFKKATFKTLYVPTPLATDEIIDAFYAKLQEALDKIPKRDVVVMMGDFNVMIGQSDSPES